MRKKPFTVQELTTIGIFTAVTAILSPFSIPLPITPVPITLGIAAVFITGILLRPKLAVFAQVCYLLLGAIGLPIFSGFGGGIGALLGPTGGYLIMYPFMAWVIAFALNGKKSVHAQNNRGKVWVFVKAGGAVVLAQILLYTGGTTWLSISTQSSFWASVTVAVYPYIVVDIVKAVVCIALFVPLRTRMPKGLRVAAKS